MQLREKIAKNKTGIILFIISALIVSAVYAGFRFTAEKRVDNMLAGATEKSEYDSSFIYVHVKGAVKQPDVYRFLRTDRVKDAVEAAGGFSENADEERVNLAAFLVDGSEIVIPSVTDGDARININTADKNTLMTLDGIGEGFAEKIIEYREKNGAFLNIYEIKNIDGINESKFSKFKDKIKVE